MSIKIVPGAIMICFFAVMASAQVEDSIAFRTNSDTTLKYVSPLEYAFMMHEETKFMLRFPVFGVGAEVEILPYFTWMTQVYYPLFQFSSAGRKPDINSEFRWYYGSRDLGVRNMSGNYLSAGAKYEEELLLSEVYTAFGYYAKWGMQRRILGNGLADIGFTAGIASHHKEEFSSIGFFVQSPVSLGLGFVFGERASLDRNRLCPVVKCHEVESFLLKINFSNLINYNFLGTPVGNYQLLMVNPNISAEKKVFDFPFSFNLDLQSSLTYEVQENSSITQINAANNIEVNAGVRWYYNMNRRIRLGKGGNGLSGNYFSTGLGGTYRSEDYFHGEEFIVNERLYSFISTGIQRTLGRRMYYDLNIGFKYASRKFSDMDSHVVNTAIYGNAQIGIKF